MHSRRDLLCGKRIRQAAKEAGLALPALGTRIGVSRATIYAYAAGTLRVPEDRLALIADATHCSATFFRNGPEGEDTQIDDQTLSLIDALMAPPNPRLAADMALGLVDGSLMVDQQETACELLHRAGNALLQRGEYVEAIHHLEQAKHGFAEVGERARSAACSQSLGYCYINVGLLEKARHCFEHAREALPPADRWMGDVSLAALSERVGCFAEATERLDAVMADPKLPEAGQTYVLANRVSLLCASGFWREAYNASAEALAMAARLDLTDQVAELLIHSGLSLIAMGRVEDAGLDLTRASDIAFAVHDKARMAFAKLAWARLSLLVGDLDEARSIASSVLAEATRSNYRRSVALALQTLAEVAAARGDLLQCYDYGMQAVGFCDANDYPVASACGAAVLVMACCRLGRLDEAYQAFERVTQACSRYGLGDGTVKRAMAEGAIRTAEGDPAAAIKAFRAAANRAEEMGLTPIAAQAWLAVASLSAGGQEEAQGRAMRLLEPLVGQRVFGMDRRSLTGNSVTLDPMVNALDWWSNGATVGV